MEAVGAGAQARRDLLAIYRAAIDAVGGRACVARFLRAQPLPSPVYLAAVGKASVHMAAGAYDVLSEAIEAALVITKHGHLEPLLPPTASVRILQASHPVPDASSLAAGAALLDFVDSIPLGARALILLSGGASSLVEVLPRGLDAEMLARINQWLLASGLPIGRMNRIRKRISRVKGGRLAAHLVGRAVLSLLISDVPGDELRAIGSGPLVPHTAADLELGDIVVPAWLAPVLAQPPPLPPASTFEHVRSEIVARPDAARAAAAAAARQRGYAVHCRGVLVEGDASGRGRELAQEVARGDSGVYVWGGETTVNLPARPGRGGRCQSLALAAALALAGRDDVWLLAAGTDGSDGPGEDAGALVDGGSVARGAAAGRDARSCLANADAGSFLAASGDLLRTGPTGTNVMDLMLALKL